MTPDGARHRDQSFRLAAWAAYRRISDRFTIAAEVGICEIDKSALLQAGLRVGYELH